MFNICKALSLKFESSLKIWAESLLETLFDTAQEWEPVASWVKKRMHTLLVWDLQRNLLSHNSLKY